MPSSPSKTSLLQLLPVLEIMGGYAVILWAVWYTHLHTAFSWFPVGVLVILGYLVVVSPWLHRSVLNSPGQRPGRPPLSEYYFQSRGIGSPLRYFRGGKASLFYQNRNAVMVMLFIISVLVYFFVRENQPALAKLFHVDASQWWLLYLICELVIAGLYALLFSVLVRWDTLQGSLRPVARVALSGMALIFALYVLFLFRDDFPFVTGTSAAEKWQLFSIQSLLSQWLGYTLWAWVQQFIFLGVFVTGITRCIDITSTRNYAIVVFVGGLLFGMAHLPNIWLFLVTLVLGFLFANVYLRHRNLFLIAVAHGLLGALYFHLLPISLAPGLSNYSGPGSLYFGAKLFVFFALPCSLFLLLYAANRQGMIKNAIVTVIFGGIVYMIYPSLVQGPDYSWGNNGNGLAWHVHDLEIKNKYQESTVFVSRGDDPYLVSNPVAIDGTDKGFIEIDMQVSPVDNDDRAAVYFDYGENFNDKDVRSFKLENGRALYRIPLQPSSGLSRLRLDPVMKTGASIQLYSLRIMVK